MAAPHQDSGRGSARTPRKPRSPKVQQVPASSGDTFQVTEETPEEVSFEISFDLDGGSFREQYTALQVRLQQEIEAGKIPEGTVLPEESFLLPAFNRMMGRAGMWDLVDLYGDDLQVYAWMQFLCSDPSVPSGKSDKARELFASYCLLADNGMESSSDALDIMEQIGNLFTEVNFRSFTKPQEDHAMSQDNQQQTQQDQSTQTQQGSWWDRNKGIVGGVALLVASAAIGGAGGYFIGKRAQPKAQSHLVETDFD